MGVIRRGILGGFSGKVANVVGGSWKGIATMRSLPLSVANPNTAAQQTVRSKFANMVDLASGLLTTICKPLWDRFAQKMSGYNAFIQANIDIMQTNGTINPPQDLIISRGSLLDTDITGIVAGAGTSDVTVNWNDNSGVGNASADDVAFIVIYNETQVEFGIYQAPQAIRSAGTAVASFPINMVAADVIYAYLAFRNSAGTLVSDTFTLNDVAV